jgi:hypothetical protein
MTMSFDAALFTAWLPSIQTTNLTQVSRDLLRQLFD